MKAPGLDAILMPGGHEVRLTEDARRKGIEFPANVITELVQTGNEFGLAFPGLRLSALEARLALLLERNLPLAIISASKAGFHQSIHCSHIGCARRL